MDQSNSFPSLFPFRPPSDSDKPALSKYRLNKRRNAANRKLSASAQESLGKFEEKSIRWNPFVPESGARVSESSDVNANAGAFGFGGMSFDAGTFVFGSGGPSLSRNSSGRSVGSLDSGKSEGNASLSGSIGSGVEKNDDSSWESSLGSDEGLVFLNLPDEMKKMDWKSSSTGYDLEKKMQPENGFVFGSTGVNMPSQNAGFGYGVKENGNFHSGVFVSGGGMKKGVDMGRDGGSFSKLLDETSKLNLKNCSNVDDFEKNKKDENVFILGGSKTRPGLNLGTNANKFPESAEFVSFTDPISCPNPINTGSEKTKVVSGSFSSEGSGNPDADMFVPRSRVKEKVDLSLDSSLGSDEGFFPKLSEEMRKMNIDCMSGVGKAKRADNDFVFEGNKYASGSFASGAANKIQEESGKLNAAADVFVFGSSTEKSSVSSFDNGNTFHEMNKEIGHHEDDDEGNSFIFGDSENATASFGGSAINTLHDDIEKLKIGSNADNLAGNAPYTFAFEAGAKNQKSNMGSIPSSTAPGLQSPWSVFSFTGKHVGLEKPHMEFRTPKQNVPPLTKETLFTETYKNMAFSAKKGNVKSTKMKKGKGKSGHSVSVNQNASMQFVAEDSASPMNSDADMFVSGSRAKENVDLSQNSSLVSDEGLFPNLPEEMRKTNIDSMSGFEKAKSADNVFVFEGNKDATGSFASGVANKMQKESGKLNAAPGVFVFGSSTEKSSVSGFDNHRKDKEIGHQEKVDEGNNFIFGAREIATASFGGSSVNTLHDDIENLKIGSNADNLAGNAPYTFAFEAGAQNQKPNMGSIPSSTPPGLQSPGSVFSFVGKHVGLEIPHIEFRTPKQNVPPLTKETLFTETYKNMAFNAKRGNVKSTKLKKGKGKSRHSASVNQNASMQFVAEDSASPVNSDADMFVSGSRVKEKVDLSQNSSLVSDEGLFPNLPEEMRKMNIDSMSGFEKAKSADNVFVFEGNKDATGSFASGVANKIQEESGKLNAAPGVFVFGSSTEKSFVSGFDNHEKDKEIGYQEKVNDGNNFIFGASEIATAFFGGSAVNTLHDDIEKLKISSNAENLAGNVPFTFVFEAGAENQKSNTGSIPSSAAPGFQSPGSFFSSTGKHVGLEIPHMEFRTPKQDVPASTKETLFTETYKNTAFYAKKGNVRSTKPKNKKGKPRPSASVKQNAPMQFVAQDSGSPMDYSPYREDVVADDFSREPSIASEDSFCFLSRDPPIGIQKSVSGDEQEEVLVSQAQGLNISEDYGQRSSNVDSAFVDQQTYELGNGSDTSKKENMDLDNDARAPPMDAQAGFFSPNMVRPASDIRSEFAFSSSLEDRGESNFTFTASRFVEGSLPAAKHNSRRKNRLKSGQNSSVSTPNARTPLASPMPDLIPHIRVSGLPESIGQKITSSVPRNEDETKAGKSKETESRQESTSSGAATDIAAQEACEKWRFRGNQAYANGHLTKAEDYYTSGVNSITLKEIPSSCIRPLTLCFSNRAATRMSLGKIREALRDCKMAVSMDPNFLKAQVRAANCHLSLGEIGEALKHFKQCLQSEKDVSSDQKYLIEASDGLQKAQQVADLTGQSAELLLRRTSNDASKALNKISEALSISPHSENLLEMKAEALLMMRNYDEVIKLCEQTLDLAEQNSVGTEADSEYMKSSPARLWRWRLIAKSYFYLGKLEESLELLQKHERASPAVNKFSESSMPFADTIRELLRLKSAGNEAFQAARHSEAVEFYSSALACNAESRPFTAVCFCNRAAAYQALGQIADAIADCSLAIALDPSYAKAISRRATLYELIRDYGQASNDLNRLISLLQKQMQEKDTDSRGVGRSSSNANDLKRARTRLATVEEEARKGISLNLYMILGIEPSSSAADVKKAYRKAALRHHPDKAGQFLVRNENVDDGLWRKIAAEVHADADRLFKIIGEAYTTLSDPTKRMQYDEEEEMRTFPINGYDVSSPRSSSGAYYSSHYEKSFNRRQWRATHASSYQR